MRRSGKSTILALIKQELRNSGVSEQNVIYLNFESLRYNHLKTYQALYDEIIGLAKNISGRVYILLDEIQDVIDWEHAINSFRVDLDCDIIITGSNASLLSGELATLIAGRYVEITIFPLDFQEFLDFTAFYKNDLKLTNTEKFSGFLRYGGLPGIHQMKWEEARINQYLTDIFNSVLLKDVIAKYSIRNTALLERITLYVMDNIGNTFSAKKISDFLKSQGRKLSTETVYNYLSALEEAFFIHRVSRYDLKGKRLLETQEKYYLSDLGFRHAIMGYRSSDIAALLENVVFLELLRRGYSVYIGKLGVAEVDFIANRGDERLYIQVTYILTEDNMNREFAPLEAIADNYRKIVISTDSLIKINRNGIQQVNILDFLLENAKW
jgi:predicted AAA+ superfamily ATPase